MEESAACWNTVKDQKVVTKKGVKKEISEATKEEASSKTVDKEMSKRATPNGKEYLVEEEEQTQYTAEEEKGVESER